MKYCEQYFFDTFFFLFPISTCTFRGQNNFTGRTNKSWKKRWFQHQNGVLQYFVSEGGKLKGEMVVRDCRVQAEGEVGFSITTKERSLHCKCETREEAGKWITAMRNN